MSQVGTPAEGARLYSRLGLCYRLIRRWQKAKEHYEAMLGEAQKTEGREQQWEALTHLAMLATDFSTQPEEDDEIFRGVRKRTEQEATEDGNVMKQAGPFDEPEAFEWSPEYALERAEEALFLAREMERDDLVANSLGAVALLEGFAGRWEGVASGGEKARTLFAAMGDRAMEAEFLNLSAWGEAMIGNPKEAIRLGRERLAATRELGNQEIHVADLHGLVLALLEAGEYDEALSVARTGMRAARSLGSAERLHFNLLLLGDTCKALFRLKEARSAYAETSEAVNIPQHRALTHSKLCSVAALEENWEEAHTQAFKAAALRGEVAMQFTDPFHRHHEIEALLRGGEEELARIELRRFAEAVGDNRRLQVAHLRARVVLKQWEGDTGAAIKSLREAEVPAKEIGLPGELWQIRAALGELHEDRSERKEAGREFAGAATIVRGLAAKIEDEELREGFLGARQVRRVLESSKEGLS